MSFASRPTRTTSGEPPRGVSGEPVPPGRVWFAILGRPPRWLDRRRVSRRVFGAVGGWVGFDSQRTQQRQRRYAPAPLGHLDDGHPPGEVEVVRLPRRAV